MYNETYDEYIRNILGYSPIKTYENDYQIYRNENTNYNVSSNMYNNSINSRSDAELESCYPEIYKIVYPMVNKKCNNVRGNITREDIENMTDEIYYALEEKKDIQLNINLTNEVRKTNNTVKSLNRKPDVKISEKPNEKIETRQINRGLRDLIQILLIRELLNRRRPGRPPIPPPPRPPMRPPFRPRYGINENILNEDFENIFENQ